MLLTVTLIETTLQTHDNHFNVYNLHGSNETVENEKLTRVSFCRGREQQGNINRGGLDKQDTYHTRERGQVYTKGRVRTCAGAAWWNMKK